MHTAVFGFGALGQAIARILEKRGDLPLTAVVDTDPALSGKQVAAADGMIEVTETLPPAQANTILFHCTTSDPDKVEAQIVAALDLGYNVISAAEWMFHPWLRYRAVAERIEAKARSRGLFVLGCGINPGFAFETLPLLLSRSVDAVEEVDILRVSNVSGIGPGDFEHIGFGLTPEAFADQVAAGEVQGHIGFPESIAALAEYLEYPVDTISEQLVPEIARAPIELAHTTVDPGEVAAIRQVARGTCEGKAVIRMTLEMHLDPVAFGAVPREEINIRGGRDFKVTIQPSATSVAGAAAMHVHAAKILAGEGGRAGLISLADLPVSRAPRPRSLHATSLTRDGSAMTIAIG